MKKYLLFPFFLGCCSTLLMAQNYTFDYFNHGRRVCLADSEISSNSSGITIHLLDAASNTQKPTSIYRRALNGQGTDWVLVADQLPAGTSTWEDPLVDFGEVWEYQLRRENTWTYGGISYDAIGYTAGSFLSDRTNYQGQLILLAAADVVQNLPDRYLRLKKELTADGWYVNEIIVNRAEEWDSGAEVVTIKKQITDLYYSVPPEDLPRQLFILGHVPLPRSGTGVQPAPDEHLENRGARGCDAFYADMDGLFTDTITYNPGNLATDLAINLPGDYKWDQDFFPSDIEMAFGRVDFADLTDNNLSELQLMSNYLDRLSQYKTVAPGWFMGNRTAFFRGYDNSNDASFRSLPNISMADSLFQNYSNPNHPQWVQDNGPFMIYMQNITVPNLADWNIYGMEATVFSSDQSYWGFGDVPQQGSIYSRIRSLLATDSKCLVTLWTTTGINVFHQIGTGETVGAAFREIMNHNPSNNKLEKAPQVFDTKAWWNRSHFAFYGDPTLRLYQVVPPKDLTISAGNEGAILQWTASPDSRIIGYQVYKSETELGKYQRISQQLISGSTFVDTSYQPHDWYMVRAVIVQRTGCGQFYNPSQGIMAKGDFVLTDKTIEQEKQNIIIFPVPVESEMTIFADFPLLKVQLYTISGQKVIGINGENKTILSIELGELNPGLYIAEIQTPKGSVLKKILIQ